MLPYFQFRCLSSPPVASIFHCCQKRRMTAQHAVAWTGSLAPPLARASLFPRTIVVGAFVCYVVQRRGKMWRMTCLLGWLRKPCLHWMAKVAHKKRQEKALSCFKRGLKATKMRREAGAQPTKKKMPLFFSLCVLLLSPLMHSVPSVQTNAKLQCSIYMLERHCGASREHKPSWLNC